MNKFGMVASKSASVAGCILVATAVWGGQGRLQPVSAEQERETTLKQSSIAVTVPDAGWRLQIERVLERENDVWLLAQLHRVPGPAAQVIRRIEVPIPVELPSKPRRVFVAGKTWAWPNKEAYDFVKSLAVIIQRAGKARVLYAAPPADGSRETQ